MGAWADQIAAIDCKISDNFLTIKYSLFDIGIYNLDNQ